MIDIKHLKSHPEKYKDSAKQRGVDIDIDKVVELEAERVRLVSSVDALRASLNLDAKPNQQELEQLQQIKQKLTSEEEALMKTQHALEDLASKVPNLIADSTPQGGEDDASQERQWGEAQERTGLMDHLALAESRGWIDFERGSKVAGSKFYFLKGPLVKLEMAVKRLALEMAEQAGFEPIEVPHLVNTRTASGTGFNPKGPEEQIYSLTGEDLHLIATAELPLTGMHADEILDTLPIKYAGWSPSYRREAGAYGKHSKGLYRVHQFNKLELYILSKPEDSEQMLQQLVELEEQIVQALEIPYRVTRTAAGDLGAPHYKKYDLEYWSPVESRYRELTSASNCTDYQARNLGIRYRDEAGQVQFVHTLNATAVAISRVLIAILENHQINDDKIKLPKALGKYYGAEEL